jgi:hypothetical protein
MDAHDVDLMSKFWSSALGYRIDRGDDGCAKLVSENDAAAAPNIWLQKVDEPKLGKNRCHLDLVAADPAAEVLRLLDLGATRADVGQTGDEGFQVMADPEGNEFCVLQRADTSAAASTTPADPDAPGLSALGLQPDDPVEPNEPA